MLYPMIGTLSNVYGADHVSKTPDPLRTVAVRFITGASKPTSMYHNNMTSITLAHLVFLIQQYHCHYSLSHKLYMIY